MRINKIERLVANKNYKLIVRYHGWSQRYIAQFMYLSIEDGRKSAQLRTVDYNWFEVNNVDLSNGDYKIYTLFGN